MNVLFKHGGRNADRSVLYSNPLSWGPYLPNAVGTLTSGLQQWMVLWSNIETS